MSNYQLLLRGAQDLAQGLTLCQAADYQCGLSRVRGLTQGQALQNPPVA